MSAKFNQNVIYSNVKHIGRYCHRIIMDLSMLFDDGVIIGVSMAEIRVVFQVGWLNYGTLVGR